MRDNRPVGHQRKVSGQGKSVSRRGDGLGSGSVGGGGGYFGSGSGSGPKRSGGGKSPIVIVVMILMLLFGGGAGVGNVLTTFLGGGSVSTSGQHTGDGQSQTNSQNQGDFGSQGGQTTSSPSGFDLGSLISMFGSTNAQSMSGSYTAWDVAEDNRGKLNKNVAESAREKFYTPKSGDRVTIMVYMLGTDLESKYGMATNDLTEMAKANLSDDINLLIYTGGTHSWKNSVISNRLNQIYQLKDGKLVKLHEEASRSMTDPKTLSDFIHFCKSNFPAQRNQLIFWDHGGGSVTGFGYDEKYAQTGAMNLSQIKSAIADTNLKFDLIGFDACLMATAETALALSDYADYMIASEETEPGTGWYYTNWLNDLSANTSIDTLDLGKRLIDDFIDVSAVQARGQSTTLSLVDLAEISALVPKSIKSFANSTSDLIERKEYAKVADARNISREFARASKIDQVDLVSLALHIGTDEAKTLAKDILSTVKYNRTSTNMANSYGLSIYFPSKKLNKVDSMTDTYAKIGMDDDYSKVIKQYATLEASGQVQSGQNASPLATLLGEAQSGGGSELLSMLLGGVINESISSITGLDAGNIGFLSERSISEEDVKGILSDNALDVSKLVWQYKGDVEVLSLPEEEWAKIASLDFVTFVNDGSGYIDMGTDNVFLFDADGDLTADTSKAWFSIDEQPVAYYHIDTVLDGDSYTTLGRVPVLLNGERADLIVVFDKDFPDGHIVGARKDYIEGETDTIAKSTSELEKGDVIDFVADYYSYEGVFTDSYRIGESYTVGSTYPSVGYYSIPERLLITYKIIDRFGATYWMSAIER